MPFKPDMMKLASKASDSLGVLVFPLMISLSMPFFLYTLVLEKEQKLVQNMKINGMRDINYMLTNYVFNLFQYCIVAAIYLAFGRYYS